MTPASSFIVFFSIVSLAEAGCSSCFSPPPSSPSEQAKWLEDLKNERNSVLTKINYKGGVFDNPSLAWTQTAYIQPQMHPYDRYFYDPVEGYTPDRYLDDLIKRYGGVDAILMWPTYTNIGVDDRNQFDYFRCMPGGLDGVKNVTNALKARGVRVLWPYNPWDTGTHREPLNDEDTFAKLLKQTNGDGFNGDTMGFVGESFWNSSLKDRYPLAFEPELGGEDESLNWDTLGWGYWTYPVAPNIDRFKFLTYGKYMTNICNRWAQDKTNDLQSAWLSGVGYESWENVWGTWNGITPRDGEAIRRIGKMLRYFGGKVDSNSFPDSSRDYFHSKDWVPHVPQTLQKDVYASKFSLGSSELYTFVNRGLSNLTNGTQQLWLQNVTNETKVYDCYRGVELTVEKPVPIPTPPKPVVPSGYNLYQYKNAYEKHGASKDIDVNPVSGLDVEQCTARCDVDASCSCVTYAKASQSCWKRAECTPSGFDDGSEYDVYTKNKQYVEWSGANAYLGHGATTEIDSDSTAPVNLTSISCQARCDADSNCGCVAFLPSNGKCWKRGGCSPLQFSQQSTFTTYVKQSMQPSCPEGCSKPLPPPPKDAVAFSFDLEFGGYGCVIKLPSSASKDMLNFFNSMASITKDPLYSFSHEWKYLSQKRVEIPKTKGTGGKVPEGTVLIPRNESWRFQVTGVMIEGDDAHGVDVQQPWDDHPHKTHDHVMDVGPFYMDIFPVTNLNYSVYLAETKYSPTDNYRWLQNWNGSTSIPPDAIKDVPVTYVSLNEARAYCSWRNARLPHEHEWQYAAQGNDGRIWPWGNDNDQSKYPTETSGTKYLGPEKVNTYSLSSASPFGVRDLVGNVYQYTDEFQDDHTRAVILRGGSNYRPSGSQWYFPQAKQNNQHEKYFLMNDRYERAGTIGFRCVQDA
jgi:formylglycine-generating enzyme required for sulfatase activity